METNSLKTQDGIVIIEEKISKVNGETQIKKYQKGKLLGKGGFAKCYEVTIIDSKKILAAKIIPKASLTKTRARQKLISEIKIHKSLHHLHVVQFEHVFEDQENVYILLELCPNQTLNELIKRRKRLIELEVQCFVVQIISALRYLHNNRVIHRDLKLGNLFINDKMELKLGDFGLATKLEFDGEKKRTICGTPNYIAPEILDGKSGHSYEVDIWSLGVIIYTLLIGKPPYETPDVKATYKKIRLNSYTFPDQAPISDSARGLITRILNLDPSKRPTLEEMSSNPFLNNGGTIPRVLPQSILGIPPSASYIKQFMSQGNTLRVNQQPQRIGDSQSSITLPKSTSKDRNNFMATKNDTKNSQWGMTSASNWTGNIGTSTVRPLSQQKSDLKAPMSMSTKNQQNPNMYSTQSNLHNIQSSNTIGRGMNLRGSIVNSGGTGNKNETWVKSWVDYSSKYGLGYSLSNGSSGVFFNDSTKIILDPNGKYIEYMERRPSDKQDIMTSYSITEYPKELQKKVTLLEHFRSYLEGEKQTFNKEGGSDVENTNRSQPLVYVKKWMKTRYAIMFRLSNKIVQVNFTDKTEILLSSENKIVTFVNRKGERSNYPLATALESTNLEMTKRLKYTREILTHMLNQNKNIQENNNLQQ